MVSTTQGSPEAAPWSDSSSAAVYGPHTPRTSFQMPGPAGRSRGSHVLSMTSSNRVKGWLIHFVKSWQPVITWPNAREGEGCRENSRDLQRVPPSSLQLSPCKWRNYLRIWKESPGEGNGYPLQYSCLENAWSSGTSVLNKMQSPWTEEPGALQFRGSQRVRHELATITHIPVGRIT